MHVAGVHSLEVHASTLSDLSAQSGVLVPSYRQYTSSFGFLTACKAYTSIWDMWCTLFKSKGVEGTISGLHIE